MVFHAISLKPNPPARASVTLCCSQVTNFAHTRNHRKFICFRWTFLSFSKLSFYFWEAPFSSEIPGKERTIPFTFALSVHQLPRSSTCDLIHMQVMDKGQFERRMHSNALHKAKASEAGTRQLPVESFAADASNVSIVISFPIASPRAQTWRHPECNLGVSNLSRLRTVTRKRKQQFTTTLQDCRCRKAPSIPILKNSKLSSNGRQGRVWCGSTRLWSDRMTMILNLVA